MPGGLMHDIPEAVGCGNSNSIIYFITIYLQFTQSILFYSIDAANHRYYNFYCQKSLIKVKKRFIY